MFLNLLQSSQDMGPHQRGKDCIPRQDVKHRPNHRNMDILIMEASRRIVPLATLIGSFQLAWITSRRFAPEFASSSLGIGLTHCLLVRD